jgi:cysteinyl-tRNA synthetase
MNHEIFNQELDIHGGGIDLKFPHHENENAQSIAHNGHGLSKYWMHSAFINLTDTKMSKSLGNVISVVDLEKDYDLIAYRLLVLAHHYQQPINYSDDLMKQYQDEYNKINRALKNAFVKFYNEMNQNLNTPNAITVVYELVKSVNREKDLTELQKYYNSLIMILKILGFEFEFKKLTKEDKDTFNKWNEARSKKDYETADKYRALLQEKGLI